MPKPNIREQIKKATQTRNAKIAPVELPELGITVHVRPAKVGDRNGCRVGRDGKPFDTAMINRYYVMLCLVDEEGVPIYDFDCDEDVAEIESMPFTDFDRILDAISKASGFGTVGKDDIEKN